jgi:hypothetical protein
MPIKSKIDIGADHAKFKQSFDLFHKYQAALKEQYGASVLQAPYIQAVSAAGEDLSKFVNSLSQAARSQTLFDAAAQKAGSAFKVSLPV